MVDHKAYKVGDKVCVGCPQNWEGDCTAYNMPGSKAEYEHRTSKLPKMNCMPNKRY